MTDTLLKTLMVGALLSGGMACSSSADVRPTPAPHKAEAVTSSTPAPAQAQPAQARPFAPTPAQTRPIPASATPTSRSAPMKAPMQLLFTRTGGIAGFNDRVQVIGDTLTVTRRGHAPVERKLTAEELAHLHALAEQAQNEPPPAALDRRPMPDAFNITVSVGAQQVALSHADEQSASWRALADALQGLINPTK